MKKTALFIDANSLIHRCFHALPPLTASNGEPIQAVYGLAMILMRITNERKPNFVAAFYDRPEPTFRKELFAEYKAHRPETPDSLIPQITESHKLFDAFGITHFEKAGYEADDLIGTAIEQGKAHTDIMYRILSSDTDLLQLVEGKHVVAEMLRKGIRDTVLYDEEAVKQRFGLRPDQLPDYKGLVGDPSDNIPGVPQIGPKRATNLLQAHGTLENVYVQTEHDSALAQKIGEWREQAFLSRHLATIDRVVPITISPENLVFLPNMSNVSLYFQSLGFETLVKRLREQQVLL